MIPDQRNNFVPASKEYFEEAAEAFHSVKIPETCRAPMKRITVDPDNVQRDFAAANPAFPAPGALW